MSHNRRMARILAAADIGSNTAHLLVAATDGDIVMRIDNLNEWINLGEVVARQGEIPKEQVEQLVGSMKEFRRVAAAKRADKIYVFATEAMRVAKNHSSVLKRIKTETGIQVDLIPPQREAEFSFYGVRLDTKEIEPSLMLEVGGGSAQVAKVDGKAIIDEVSLPLGTGRIIAESGMANPCPPSVKSAAMEYIDRTLSRLKLGSVPASNAIASGGVARGLWRALHPDGEKKLVREELEYLIWSTERLNVERIIERFSVKPKRAGTLLPGAMVYHGLMNHFGLDTLFVSEFGVREGAILDMARGSVKGQTP
jgi:exopolyphosphatase/guanosine-5'-triphosphate,3'-diphosphate pyrophosphatase